MKTHMQNQINPEFKLQFKISERLVSGSSEIRTLKKNHHAEPACQKRGWVYANLNPRSMQLPDA
jgi:hypothetical protein